MNNRRYISAAAVAVALGWTLPAQAQSADSAAVRQELAEMRAQMQRMTERIDTLESQLAQANAKADTATQAAGAAAAAAAKAPPLQVAWKGAPEFSAAGGWSFKPRGRMQLDIGGVNAPRGIANSAQLGVSAEFRRLYMGFDGTLPGGFGYRVEADFANSDVALTDVFLTYKPSKQVTLTLGHHKPFGGLEELTSDLFPTVMERAAFTSAFGFERRVGLSATYSGDTLLVQGGVFTDDAASLNLDTNKNWSIDGRVVAMPKVGGGTLHVGASAHMRELGGSATSVRYRARPFVHTTDLRLVDTGAFTARRETSFGAELAYIAGPLHAMVEGHRLTVTRAGRPDPTFQGAYAEIGYLLTGEDTAYKAGVYERIKPRRPVGGGGLGALQLNARYDWLDLTDAGVNGGSQHTAAISLVWIPTDYVRFIANYGHIWVKGAPVRAAGDPDYGADAVGMRAQFDF